jgi:hypothetical protein
MTFTIRMGLPEMAAVWTDLTTRDKHGKLDANEQKDFRKLGKALNFLRQNPHHNSLATHEITDLTSRYGFKVFQSYLENNTPAAGRFFWAYGPDRGEITVLGIEPHPEDSKNGAYKRFKLSVFPPATPKLP